MMRPQGQFLGVEVFAERRRYGASKTFTWLYAKWGTEFVALGDPWECITPKRTEVEDAIRTHVRGNVCEQCSSMVHAALRDGRCPLCADRFALTNPPPGVTRQPLTAPPSGKQLAMFGGMDCLPDQAELFSTDALTSDAESVN